MVLPLSFAATIAPTPLVAGIVAAFCLAGAGLAGTAARYLAGVDPSRLPESPGLCRGARVAAWILVAAALSCGLVLAGLQPVLRILEFAVLAINAAVCYGLFRSRQPRGDGLPAFPLDVTVLSVLGTRTNLLASILDSAEAQLGIDLRSTWALTVVRRSLEPLVIGLCLLAWLSTSLTVVGVDEQGLVERLGVPVGGDPLTPGLHLHWPWPMDRVFRIPVKQVQALAVGHEGEEGKGPENVLWAVEHAANEYTLLLGNGRDLITVDATVQFRIADARAWRYHSQNPAEALKAIAYRAVMRSTVNRTLSEALSENVATLTARMRTMVQSDADALGLGVEVMAFTVGGMHPPVMVASDYQGVVSAELGKVTAMVNAQVFRNQTVPQAQTAVLTSVNTARAQGAENLAKAAGQAWSFRTLESQFRAAPEEYNFRRRLETLEKGLAMRPFTVVDTRFQRDGGELWLMP
jgi:regulator of protease activity HflC (stomatin/prohibitin superfamily)